METAWMLWVCGPFCLGTCCLTSTIDWLKLQEPGPIVPSKAHPSASHYSYLKVHKMEPMKVQEGNCYRAPPSHQLLPLSNHPPLSRSSLLLPHSLLTTGSRRTTVVMALTRVLIKAKALSRSVSIWIHPRRKRKTLSSLPHSPEGMWEEWWCTSNEGWEGG